MEQRRKLLSGFVRHPGFWTTACLTLLTSLLFQFGAFAATAPNNIISYQGRVLDAGGVPLGDATATMIFRLYDAVSGGSCLWSNSSATCASATGRTVTLTDGLFSENLGDTNAGTPYAAIADTVFADNAAVYLSISVNGELLTPRKLLTAAPYALNAQALDGLSASGFLQTSMTGATTVTFGGSTYALTFTNNGSGNEVHNLSSTGDLVIQDNGTPIATFADTGAITFAGTSGQAMTFGTTAANLILQTTTSGDITATTGAAAGLLNVLTGNLKVGNGTPGVTLDGEDAYIEGTLEVDGAAQFDGTVTVSDLVCTDCLNFSDLSDTLTLDATTFITFGGVSNFGLTFTNDGTSNETHNLTSTGDFVISDAGTPIATFADTGAITFAATSGQAITLGTTSANLALQTTTSGDITATTGAASGLLNVLTGNLKVGNGTPGVTLDGEDAYIEGTLEVDGSVQFDGTATVSDLVCTDCLNFSDLGDALTLDASTSIGFGAGALDLTFTNNGSGNEVHNLSSTGDFIIQDNGTAFFTADDSKNLSYAPLSTSTFTLTSSLSVASRTASVMTITQANDAGFNFTGTDTNSLFVVNQADTGSSGYAMYVNQAGTGYALLVDAGDVIADGNVVVGGSTSRTETISNGSFSLGGDDLFVAGSLGVEGTTFFDGVMTLAGSADGTDALVLTTGDIAVTDGDLDVVAGDFNVGLDASDEVDITKSATAASTEEGIDLTFTAGAGDGSDVYSAIRVAATSANHAASSDKVYGLNLANLSSADAEGEETAIFIGTGWDNIWSSASSSLTAAGVITVSDLTCTDCLDFAEFSDSPILDASTAISFGSSTFALTFTNNGSGNEIHNLSSTGDFVIQDGGTPVFTVTDAGAVTIAGTSASAVTVGTTAATLALQTTTSGDITATTGAAAGLVNVLTGNLKVGNGTPGVSLNGEDAYIEGTFEVDGTAQFDSTVTVSDLTCTDCLDFAEFEDTLDLDAPTDIQLGGSTYNLTFINNGSGNEVHNLSSTGDLVIQDNGTPFVTFSDAGNTTFTLGATGQVLINASSTAHTSNAPLALTYSGNGSGYDAASSFTVTSTGMTGGSADGLFGTFTTLVADATDATDSGLNGHIVLYNSAADTSTKAVGYQFAASDNSGAFSNPYVGDGTLTAFQSDLRFDANAAGAGSIYGNQYYLYDLSIGGDYVQNLYGSYTYIGDIADAGSNVVGVGVVNAAALAGDYGFSLEGDWTYGLRVGTSGDVVDNGLYFQGATVDITAAPGEDLVIQPASGGAGNIVLNLPNTGDLQIKDNGTAFFTFSDNGTTTQTLSTADTLSANTLTVTTTGLGATEAAFGHNISLNADSTDNQGAQFAGTAVQFTDGASDLNQQGLFVYGSNDYNGSWGLSGAPLTQDGAYKGVQVILEGAPGSNNQGRIIGAEIGLTNSGSNYVNELMGVNVDISELASNSGLVYGFSVNNSDTGVDDGPYIGDAGLRVQGGWEYGVDLSGITGSSVALMTGSAPIDLQAATNQDLDISGNGSGNILIDLPSTGSLYFQDNGDDFLTLSNTGGFGLLLDNVDNPAMTVDNQGSNNIQFNLAGTGDFTIQDSSSTFLTISDTGNLTYVLDATDDPGFNITDLGQLGVNIYGNMTTESRSGSLLQAYIANDGSNNFSGTTTSSMVSFHQDDTASSGTAAYILQQGSGYAFQVDDTSGDSSPFLIDADGNVFLGATAETNSNSGFSMNGDDMFIAGSLGVESSVYTDGSFVAGASTTISNGSISQSSGETLAIGTTSADLTLQTSTSGDIVLSPASDVVLSPTGTGGVGIGTASPITALHVPVRIPTSATATITTGASTDVHGVFAQGRYVYFVVEDGASDELRVYDYSVPGSPTQMGTGRAVTSSNDYNLYVQGQYAYVYGGTTLSIFDVSNPSDTSAAVGTVSVNNSSLAYISDLYVAGRYAYVLAGGSDTVQIVDVSNPASPAIVGTINTYNTTSTTPNSIEVKGDYAYIATNNSSTSDDFILVYDVSNPAEATLVDGTPTTTGECDTAMDFTVQGRYGYVACYSAGTFETYDLSDPTAVVQTDVLSTGVSFPWGVFVQGRYAFVGHNASTSVKVIDISDPTTASIVGTITTSGSVVNDVFVNGRYLFTGNDSSTESVNIFDLGGSYIQQFEAGGIEAGALNLRNGLYATDGTFLGGLSVSQSLQVSGGISAGSSALTQITTNTATLNTFDIQAAALVQNTAAGTINWRGTNMLMPNITQTTGTITADGLRIVNGSITTAGTENMINLAAAGVGAGTLRALNIGSITPSSGTETAITVGSGWDTGISLTTGAATTAWNLDATTNDSTLTSGVVDLNIDTATNSNIGFNIDYTSQSGITAASDVFAAVINLTQNDADGDLFGMFVNAAAVSTTQSGTNYYECLLCAENDENSSAAVLAAVWINSSAGTAGSITNGILINTTDVTTDFNMQNAETISNDTNGTVTIAGSSNAALVDFIDAASGSVVADFDGSVRLDLNIAGSSTEAVCSTVGGEGDTNTVLDDCTTTVSADYMEMYPTAADVGIGDILVPGTETVTTQTGSTLRQMVKSSGAYQSNVLGIASNPADAGDFNSIGHNIADEDRPWPVALNGRVPVKVNSENGSIVPGDMITTSSVPGVGMKATEPGMVVGMAIDSWTGPGTGTVMVFVQTGWHAGSAISNDGSMPLFTDSVAFASLGTATAVETGKDSETLSFLGSGWNGTSAEQVGMGIKLAATDATAYRLSFTNKTDTEVAYVTGTGDLVLSGKLYPSDRGTAQTDKYIYYDGSAGPGGDFMRTNASGWSTGSYDFAEMFPSTQGLAPGELVVASSTGEKEHVERSTLSYQKALLGIVSTKPGFLAGDNKEGHFPIALKGRVPTLVTAENGPIAVGDPLTSSSTPGYAMKAVKAGPVVGYALEPFTGSQGSVIAFVSLGWWEPDAVVAPVTATTSGVSNTASQAPIGSTASSLTLEGNLFMTGNSILSVGRIAGIADRWSIEEDGTVKTEGTYKAVITSLQNEKVDTYATLNREQKITLSGTGRLVNGAASIQFEAIDPKFNDITSTSAPVRVLVTLRGPANGVYVALADHNGFDVRELANGTSTVDFDWYAEAYRLGQEPPTMLETPTEPAPTESAPPEPAPVVTEPAPIAPEPVVTEPPPVVEPTAPAPTEPVAPEPVVWAPAPTDPVPTP